MDQDLLVGLQRLRQLFRERALWTARGPFTAAGAPLASPRRTLIGHRSGRRHRRVLTGSGCDSAGRRLVAGRRRVVAPSFRTLPRTRVRPAFGTTLWPIPWPRGALRLWRLRGICAQQTVLQGRSIETADYGVHFLVIRRFDERESLGLLCFRIADNLNCVC